MEPNVEVVIDHSAYPHIIDRILYFTGKTALKAWRATSHDLQQSADAHLAQYFTISTRPPFEILGWWGEDTCCLDSDMLIQSPSLVTPAVRILDIDLRDYSSGGIGHEADAAYPLLPDLQLVRVHDAFPMCDFPSPLEYLPSAHTVHFTAIASHEAPYLEIYPHPQGTGDVFVNLRFDDTLKNRPFWDPRDPRSPISLYEDVESTVYFFMTAPYNTYVHAVNQTWSTCFQELARGVPEVKKWGYKGILIFVGDEMPEGRSVVSEVERDFLTSYLASHYSKNPTPPGPEPESVKFMTFDEMRKLVGGEMFDLIMEPEL